MVLIKLALFSKTSNLAKYIELCVGRYGSSILVTVHGMGLWMHVLSEQINLVYIGILDFAADTLWHKWHCYVKGGGGVRALLTAPVLDKIPVFTEQIGGRFGQN